MKEGKVWGTTENIYSNSSFEFHRIEFKKIVNVVNINTSINGMDSMYLKEHC